MFKVEKIINGNTIMVNPEWSFADHSGNEVIVNGYVPEFSKKYFEKVENTMRDQLSNEISKKRLEDLVLGKFVKLILFPNETSDYIQNGKIKCRVFLNGVDISKYFLEFKNEYVRK